jgi:uncharacterized protein YgiM (DUF1202 family)
MRIILFAAALAVGLIPAPAAAEYVSGTSLNCRSAPSSSAEVITKLFRGQEVTILENEGSWARLEPSGASSCWVASRYLLEASPAPMSFIGNGARPSKASRRKSYSSRGTRSSSRSRSNVGGSCPCSGSNVCVGPRGGRYCITSSGNKRYGV